MKMRKIGYDKSSFFRFTFCPFDSLCKILKNDFSDIYNYEYLIPHTENMVKNTKYNITFHSKMISQRVEKMCEFVLPDRERRKIYEEEYKKNIYLINKWKDQIKNGNKIVYFLTSPTQLSKNQLIELRNLILHMGSNNFKIVYLTLEHWNTNISLAKIEVEKLKFFAPYNDVLASDDNSYERIFTNFKLTYD